jgi:hypothetical protein
MDTEGYELQVLAGATNFLEERKIAMILSEVGFRPSDFRHTFFTKIYCDLWFLCGNEVYTDRISAK